MIAETVRRILGRPLSPPSAPTAPFEIFSSPTPATESSTVRWPSIGLDQSASVVELGKRILELHEENKNLKEQLLNLSAQTPDHLYIETLWRLGVCFQFKRQRHLKYKLYVSWKMKRHRRTLLMLDRHIFHLKRDIRSLHALLSKHIAENHSAIQQIHSLLSKSRASRALFTEKPHVTLPYTLKDREIAGLKVFNAILLNSLRRTKKKLRASETRLMLTLIRDSSIDDLLTGLNLIGKSLIQISSKQQQE
ncbi:hypothetical protein RCL1_002472 [Eukaryota sp. TZLM3-RCL]